MATRGQNPNSLENLKLGGRKPDWGEKKRRHNVSLTDAAWEGTQAVLKAKGYASVSEFLEFLGREALVIPERPTHVKDLLK